MFYCYILLDPTKPGIYQYENFKFDFEPFYVGKGKSNRINSHDKIKDTKTHKGAKIQKIKKLELEVIKIKLFENLTESTSFELEVSTISIIGRKDKSKGPLLNLTDGGEGTSGKIYTKEEKLHKSIKSKEWWFLLKEDRISYEDYIKKLSSGVSKAQTGVPYEIRYGDRAEEIRIKKSEWTKENFHRTGLGQMDFKGENNPMFGKSIKDIWIEKYGIEEAEIKHKEWIANKSGKIPHNKLNIQISQKDKEGNLIKIWNGYPEGFSKPNICKALKGERKFANGFIWEYVR
jgi:hypothetical protein